MRGLRAAIVLAGLAAALAWPPAGARAQDGGARDDVTLEDSRSSFTSSTPNPYVRFFARNGGRSAHVLRVVSLKLLPRGGAPITVPISRLVADHAPFSGALTLAPGAGPLVEVWFDDPTGALLQEHEEAVFLVRVTVDGAARELTVRVPHAIREPMRSP